MRSESTVFLGQPRLTKCTFVVLRSSYISSFAVVMNSRQRHFVADVRVDIHATDVLCKNITHRVTDPLFVCTRPLQNRFSFNRSRPCGTPRRFHSASWRVRTSCGQNAVLRRNLTNGKRARITASPWRYRAVVGSCLYGVANRMAVVEDGAQSALFSSALTTAALMPAFCAISQSSASAPTLISVISRCGLQKGKQLGIANNAVLNHFGHPGYQFTARQRARIGINKDELGLVKRTDQVFPSGLTPVLPPMLESTWATIVVGTWTYGTPRK